MTFNWAKFITEIGGRLKTEYLQVTINSVYKLNIPIEKAKVAVKSGIRTTILVILIINSLLGSSGEMMF